MPTIPVQAGSVKQNRRVGRLPLVPAELLDYTGVSV